MGFVDSVRLAVGTLTIWPAGAVGQLDRRVAGTAMTIAPFAVVPLAIAAAGAGALSQLLGWPSLLSGLLVLAVLAVGTRALHLDGLADTADGLGSGWDRDRALTVMRRGDVGPMGVTALILTLGAQTVAIAVLLGSWPGTVLVAVLVCCSRCALSVVCQRGVPAARESGLGAAVAGSVSRLTGAMSWLLVLVAAVGLYRWGGQHWWRAIITTVVTLLIVSLFVWRCVRRLGGVTGDVMGAAVEIAFMSLLVLSVP
jgi:adenosylcobinamide-GDP ribazoletransferase